MARPQVEVRGATRLRATLRQAGMDMQDLKDANARAAATVAAAARTTAPRVTGTLVSTIRSTGTARAGVVRAGYKRTPYAGPNNWGWPTGSAPRGHYGGSDFITTAAANTQARWLPIYLQDLDRILSKVQGI